MVLVFGWSSADRVTRLVLVLTFLSALASSTVRAFCRETVDSTSEGPCAENSSEAPLFWNRSCVSYIFNDQAFKRLLPMTESEVRNIFATCYQTWANVQCDNAKGTIPFLVAQTAGKTTPTSASEFVYDKPNESIVVVREASEWVSPNNDHDPNALALTLIWHDKHSGEILDVDMELNKGTWQFVNCSSSCNMNDVGKVDLQNTVTHEAGHLLGLGHSTVPGATMQPRTTRTLETSKRVLKDDDKAGYCSLELPAGPCAAGASCVCPAAPVFPSKKTVRSCGCQTVGAESAPAGLAGMGLASLALARRARRRQLQRACLRHRS
jgi:MYXO-CTERM domain-containing protein